MLRKLTFLILPALVMALSLGNTAAYTQDLPPLPLNMVAHIGPRLAENTFEVSHADLQAYDAPDLEARKTILLYKGMDIEPTETLIKDGYKWFKFGPRNYWIPALEPGGISNVHRVNLDNGHIEDYYGVLDQPHNYAVKFVKLPGASGYIETYKKVGDEYVYQNTYEAGYPKEGPKDAYGDYKTVGGNVVRYLYRTTRTGMSGWDSDGNRFGAYKVSFPMPHDGYNRLMEGRLTDYQYNKLPAINKYDNGQLYPHPESNMGANIVLHTKRKGSRGCIMIPNEAMSDLYHKDLVTENDTEIIPFIIYDEDVIAPPAGVLI